MLVVLYHFHHSSRAETSENMSSLSEEKDETSVTEDVKAMTAHSRAKSPLVTSHNMTPLALESTNNKETSLDPRVRRGSVQIVGVPEEKV